MVHISSGQKRERRKAASVRVSKKNGEAAIAHLRSIQLLDESLRIRVAEDSIIIPVLRRPSKEEAGAMEKEIIGFQLGMDEFTEKTKRPRTLLEALEGQLPPHLLASLPKSIDIVGEVAVVEILPELREHRKQIGEAILKVNRNIHTVMAKAGAVSTPLRLRELENIAGKDKTETLYREHGCIYRLDLKRVYFSPRLSFEHQRVAHQVGEGEVVVDMFAGVGPFSILIAKRLRDVRVYAIDVNPYAIRFLAENANLNNVRGKVTGILGDAEKIVEERLSGIADRVIMNLPTEAEKFVGTTCKALKPTGGIMHYYSFSDDPQPLDNAIEELSQNISLAKRKVERLLHSRLMRPTAPHEWQVVIDARII